MGEAITDSIAQEARMASIEEQIKRWARMYISSRGICDGDFADHDQQDAFLYLFPYEDNRPRRKK
jgi:hypothetical protein